MDLEILYENITQNSTFVAKTRYEVAQYLYMEIPILIVTLLSTISNVLIILTIIKSHILHTRSYFYLVNWCICSAVVAISFVVFFFLGVAEAIEAIAFCIWHVFYCVFSFGNVIFVGIVAVDWYTTTFVGQGYFAIKCRKSYRLIITTVWFLISLLFVATISLCLNLSSFPLAIQAYLFSFFIVFAILIIICVMRMIKLKTSNVLIEKRNLEFKLVMSFFLCWLPNVISFILSYIHFNVILSLTLEYLFHLISYTNACVLLVLLYLYDKNFKKCLGVLLNVKFRQSVDDANEDTQNPFLVIAK